MPMRLKKKMVRNESHHPMYHICGPSVPREKVLTVKLADILTYQYNTRKVNIP